MFKKVVIAAAIAAMSVGAHAAVGTGDILFTGIGSDNNNVSQWTMQTFATVAANSVINFTDSNYKPAGATTTYGFVGSTVANTLVAGTPEALLSWNVGTTALAAGTEITFTMNKSTSVLTATVGSMTLVSGTINGFSGTADSLWAFNAGATQDVAASFVAGLSTYTFGTNDYNTGSMAASGLTGQVVGLKSTTAVVKYAYYNGATTAADWAAAKTQVGTLSNWSVSAVASGADIGAAALSVTAVPEPSTYAMLLAGLGMMGFIARRRTRA